MQKNSIQKPKYGWTVKMNHLFPEKGKQRMPMRLRQIIPFIPLFVRYLIYYIWRWFKGKSIIMDFLKVVDANPICGVPIGGIGGGSIGRSWKGDFLNFQMTPGMYEYHTVEANQFILTIRDIHGSLLYQRVLSPNSAPKDGRLKSWSWGFPGELATYTALYPRSWSEYFIPEFGVRLTCRQVSPAIPHNYKDSCLPGCVFVWQIENDSSREYKISITFTFKNGTGSKYDSKGKCSSRLFRIPENSPGSAGVELKQMIKKAPCSYTIAGREKEGVTVTRCPYFNPKGNGEIVWNELATSGCLNEHPKACSSNRTTVSDDGEEHGVAVSVQTVTVQSATSTLEFALVWDMPEIFFGGSCTYKRYYTKFFPGDGSAGPLLADYALTHYEEWEEAIYNWQFPILDDVKLPAWYKSALFNETYYVTDGGTVWLLPDEKEQFKSDCDPRSEYGRFGYLEGHEYRMYNTYDVHFYASFTLARLWPKLQSCVQYDYKDTVMHEDARRIWYLFNGEIGKAKSRYAVPHDMGDPEDEPYRRVNAYNIHNVSDWRDLNLKFVLQCYRDYCMNRDKDCLKDMWMEINAAFKKARDFDPDMTGLIVNSGSPDQTYDCWTMTGHSAYCGSLYVASLYALLKLSQELDDSSSEAMYLEEFEKAKSVFQAKLWNGLYYDFDSSKSAHSSVIMSDQLCGLWYLDACGVTDKVFPKDHVKSALKTIYNANVCKFRNGEMGAVNGMTADGKVDTYAVQSEEVWTGVVYGLAALMIHEGLDEEGFHTAFGVYNTVYNKIGLGFQTPEALYENYNYRSVGYMRPLSIWSIQNAWEMNRPREP